MADPGTIASAAPAALLEAGVYTVRLRKLDPYLNVDPGTMSPFEHGEVFVTDDGGETWEDLNVSQVLPDGGGYGRGYGRGWGKGFGRGWGRGWQVYPPPAVIQPTYPNVYPPAPQQQTP